MLPVAHWRVKVNPEIRQPPWVRLSWPHRVPVLAVDGEREASDQLDDREAVLELGDGGI